MMYSRVSQSSMKPCTGLLHGVLRTIVACCGSSKHVIMTCVVVLCARKGLSVIARPRVRCHRGPLLRPPPPPPQHAAEAHVDWQSVIDRVSPAIVALQVTAARSFQDNHAGAHGGTGLRVGVPAGVAPGPLDASRCVCVCVCADASALLDLCMSSLRRGHANLPCIVEMFGMISVPIELE